MSTPVDDFSAQKALSQRTTAAVALNAGRDERMTAAQKRKAAQEFASLLFLEVLKAMRASVPTGGLFEDDSASQNIYMSLADVEVARAMGQREGVGLTKFLEKALDAYDRIPAPLRSESLTTTGLSQSRSVDRHFSGPAPSAPDGTANPMIGGPEAFSFLPVDGRITSHFGVRRDPLGQGERRHKGLDIAAPAGTPVRAVAPGRVVFSSRAGGYGNLVVIDHGNGLTTRYAHNRNLRVSVGDPVRAGQEIAQVGSTGRSTGPHLHFEVIRNGYAVDPLAAIANFPSATKLAARVE
jgi:murein DD-endopeptidase MepM/ murein hydrolase activator NlpD